MPYSSLAQANPSLRNIKPPITLAQANLIAKWADAMEEAEDSPESPWAAAIAQFKKLYKAEGDGWVKKEKDTAKARGEGQGQDGDRQGKGPPSKCVCPKCGATVKHKPDVPCSTVKCPKCGAKMEGKDEKKANDFWAVKSLGEDRIGQYAVRWGNKDNPDLISEFFTPETDFWLGTWPRVPVLYHHGYNPKLTGRKSVVGQWDTFKSDDIGLWVEGELEKAHAYREAIDQLISEKSLWLSSAALPRRDCIIVGDDGHIKSWPIVEVSLTPTPMEPRMADVAFLKANFEFETDLDKIKRKELVMEKKSLWQAVGEAFGKALGRLDEPVVVEQTKEPQKAVPDAELDAEGAKALAETLGAQIGETVTKAMAETTAELRVEVETLKAQLTEFGGRLSDTEKTSETKVAEIMERLPPVVAAPASASVATIADATKAPKKESDFMKLVADLVDTGLKNQILMPSAEIE